MFEVNLLIDGKDRAAQSERTFERRNPVSGEVATRAASASVEDAERTVQAAAQALPAWAALGPGERRRLLNAAAEALEARTDDFVQTMMAETGATAPWAGFNVHLAANMLREAAALTTQVQGSVIPTDVPDNMALSVRQPAGVVLGIAPWNAPVILGVRAVATPLACGNTVVLKASESCPATHRLIGTVLNEAGLPEGVLNVLTNAPEDAAEVVEALIAHRSVRRVNFTGSTKVGRIIGELCGKHLKPAVLELGGKNPLIVLEDADLDAAVDAAAFSAFMNQGQICMSAERIVVDERVADEFTERLAAKAASLSVGDPSGGDVVLGSIVSEDATSHVTELIEEAQAKGAGVHRQGETRGTLMPATVLSGVNAEMRVYHEESFGPIASVVRVQDEDEAVRVANDTDYGLTAAIFSQDIAKALRLAKRLETGICHINGPTVHDEAQMPFGGVKASGYGRFGGQAAIDAFTDLRWITIQTGPRHYPF